VDATLNALAKIIQTSWASLSPAEDDGSSPDFANMLLQSLEQEFPQAQAPALPQGPRLSSLSPTALLGTPPSVAALAQEAAQKYGVDPKLVQSVIRAESGFNPNAVSPAGAKGLMQLMPSTAASLGVKDALDPAQNIDGGVRYLSKMLYRYHDNVPLAVAAYNAGPGAVDHAGGIPDFAETRAYVKKVLEGGVDTLA
jgi:soluble lytic murein transglycosylase-like protein